MNLLKSDRDNTMSTNDKYFDTLAFVKELKRLGVSEELAEFQARQFENVIDIASYARDPATRADLKQVELALAADLKRTELALAADLRQTELALAADLKQTELALTADLKQTELALTKDIKQLDTEVAKLDAKIVQLETDLKIEIKQLETEIKKLDKEIATIYTSLSVKIEKYRYDSLKFTVWTGVGVVVSLSGLLTALLAKGFHWF